MRLAPILPLMNLFFGERNQAEAAALISYGHYSTLRYILPAYLGTEGSLGWSRITLQVLRRTSHKSCFIRCHVLHHLCTLSEQGLLIKLIATLLKLDNNCTHENK